MRRAERYRESKSEAKISTQPEQQVMEKVEVETAEVTSTSTVEEYKSEEEQKEGTGKERHQLKPLEASTEREKTADGDEGESSG
uniref:Uncharacterized protein n=1 Tax=Timema douglasi TaxID=61478 RepID=A0A7R8VMH1_TIMDO|nr:unnamed protein product [Timema douglasi]